MLFFNFKTANMQITKFTAENIDIVNVYRSSKGNSAELLAKLIEMITPRKPTLMTGDFMNHSGNRMSKGLKEGEGFQQLMKEPTHILGGHIDHIYWRDDDHVWKGGGIITTNLNLN